MERLEQRHGYYHKTFQLYDDYVAVTDRSLLHQANFQIDYLELGLKSYEHTDFSARRWEYLLLLLGVVFAGVAIAVNNFGVRLGFGIAALVMLSIYVFFRVQRPPAMIYLVGGKHELSFLATDKNAETTAFIEALKERVKAAYHAEYIETEEDLSKEERRQIIDWLHDLKVLNRTEKSAMIAELERTYMTKIGFRRKD
ncbi:MAG: hypothetical protein D6772_16275 [Bacteroidetes bacterium]|nr:MAG: hypothetical protein D6772_16275 [Bacteroidota bacterium]